MPRNLIYCSILITTFFVGVLVVFNFNWKSNGQFANAQKRENHNSLEITNQNQTDTSQNEILPALEFDELKVNGIGLGTPHSTVLRRLGKPLQSKKSGTYPCGDLEMTLRYSGLEIKLEKDEESRNYNVVSIEITSPKWLVSGITVGATREDVEAKFKYRSHITKESNLQGLHYGNGDGGTSFYFRDNKLVSVDWNYNWC